MKRNAKVISDASLRNLKPTNKPYRISAGECLFLLIQPSGSKLWQLRFRIKGKENIISLGAYPKVPLALARTIRNEINTARAIGEDLDRFQKRKAKEEKNLGSQVTFKYFAERWYTNHTIVATKPWAEATAQKIRLYLDKDILPALGDKAMVDITRSDLKDLNLKIEERKAFDIAKSIRGWLKSIFTEACNDDIIQENIALSLQATIHSRGVESTHHPTVEFDELPNLLSAVDATNTSLSNKLAIRVLLLTALRTQELRFTKWKDIDFKENKWTVPKEHMKLRKEHTMILPSQLASILKSLKLLANGSEYIFPGKNGEVPISPATINSVFKMAGYDGIKKPRQTGHGFRHLVSTELNEKGYNSDWIEAQLAHKTDSKNKIRGVYNHAIYLEQRGAMMQEWANTIEEAYPDLILSF